MFREINERLAQFEKRKPFELEIANQINLINAVDWAYSGLHLSGSEINKEIVGKIVRGQFVVEATIEDHSLIEGYEAALKETNKLLEMDNDLNEKILMRLFSKFMGGEAFEYRRGNPVILTFGFNPVYSKDIKNEIEELFKWLYSGDVTSEINNNEILRGAYLYNRFIEIYPFDEYTEEMAGVLMHYYLMQKGYPPFVLRFSQEEYYHAVSSYIKKNDISLFYNCLERSLYNKVDVLLQITEASY